MTPQGVEHDFGGTYKDAKALSTDPRSNRRSALMTVQYSVTPQGVEHPSMQAMMGQLQGVQYSVTPQGVEHAGPPSAAGKAARCSIQ